MPRIEYIDETPYAAGNPWTAADAENLSEPMLGLFDALVLRHAKANGKHRDLHIPIAAALVTVSGTTPTLRSSYNVSAVSRVATGQYKLDLSVTLVADAWGAEVSCILNDSLHAGAYYDTTTTTSVHVHLVTIAGVGADVSFMVLIYGAEA